MRHCHAAMPMRQRTTFPSLPSCEMSPMSGVHNAYKPASNAYTHPIFDGDKSSVWRKYNGNVVGIPPNDVETTNSANNDATNVGCRSTRLTMARVECSTPSTAS